MGSNIENGISTKYMAFLYIISGFGGNLLSSVLNPTSYGVGASTAVFGLVGYYFQYIFTAWDFMGYEQPRYNKHTKVAWC
jgi:membrane associated rhomboid family serine protease|tara:strand:+ start:566 stop:805 length:240 start_codon:yes stop_codon:yes gene_type:complete